MIPRGRAAALLGLVVGAVLVVLSGGPASAHTELVSTSPPAGSVLAHPPDELRLRFSEPVTTPARAVRVVGPSGSPVSLGPVRSSGSLVTVDLPAGLAGGSYRVVWRVVAEDSHPVSGTFSFAVGERSAVPAGRAATAPRSVALTLGALRWLGFLGAALLVGGLTFAMWCRPPPSARLVRQQVAGSVLVAVGALASLLVKGPYDAALGWRALGRLDLLEDVLATTYGRATLTRALLAALLGAVVLAGQRLSRGDLALVGGILVAWLAASFALAGHAVTGPVRVMAVVSESAHVLAMSSWLGGLVALAGTAGAAPPAEARPLLARFSRLALAYVVALVATGLFQSWRQLGSVSALATTSYGRLLAAKVGVVLLLLAVAASTRALVRRRGAIASIRQSLALEVVLGGLVLAVTAALVVAEPARMASGR